MPHSCRPHSSSGNTLTTRSAFRIKRSCHAKRAVAFSTIPISAKVRKYVVFANAETAMPKGFAAKENADDNCRYGIFDLQREKKRVRSKFDQLRCRGGQGKPSVTTTVRIRPRTSFRGNSIFVIALIGWIVSNKIKQRGGRTAPLFEIASAAYP